MQYACQRVQTPHHRGRVGRAAGELPRLLIPDTAQTRPGRAGETQSRFVAPGALVAAEQPISGLYLGATTRD